ncbi:MAG: 2Fe-2S iron-sulfur cluster-binding protein [Elusimicrobiota bacterium]|jgi:NADH-quinone oxidoreductase subunit G
MAADITLSIDGKSVTVPEGTLVIEAAKKTGLEIPHYCYHPALGNPGVCRLCLVQVEGMPKLQVACRLNAKAGMVVRTDSELARRAQASSLEFHLVNHPLDCPVCDQAGECMLQDYYQRYGLYASTVKEDKRHKAKRVDLGPHVMLDAERCVLCSRCTRFCSEVPKTHELGIFQRGDRSEIGLAPGKRLDNPYSGNVVDLCPVGALTDKDFRFQVRVWYLDSAPSVCTGCARGCSIDVHTSTLRPWHNGGRRLARLKPRQNPAVNGWWMCDEGRYGFAWTDGPARLSASSLMKGKAPGAVATDDALKLVAAELSELCRTKGPEGLAVVLSASLSCEDLYAAKKLFSERLKAGHVLVAPGPDGLGEEDALLRRREKVANLRGAQALSFGSRVRESSWDALREGLRSGKVWGVYAVDRDPLAVLGDGMLDTLARLPFTLHQGARANLFTGAARWVLPSASPFEKDATYANFEGRLQRARKALSPLGEARPDWALFAGVLRGLGAEFSPDSAAAVFAALAKEEKPFSGLSFDLPAGGELLR